MDKGYEKERFESLSIKSSVAKKFRIYSRSISESQSMTLLYMIEFFQVNEVSPKDRLGETISSLKYQMKRRFNAVIAIIKNIEKYQTKPTNAMLLSLFEENLKEETPLLVEKKFANIIENEVTEEEEGAYNFGEPRLITENEELSHYQNAYCKIQEEYSALKYRTESLLKNVRYVKNSFGKSYYRLDITKQELEVYLEHINKKHS